MSDESPTPLTDAAEFHPIADNHTYVVDADFARKLEQENIALKAKLDAWSGIHWEIHHRAEKEHAEADNTDFTVTIEIEEYRKVANL